MRRISDLLAQKKLDRRSLPVGELKKLIVGEIGAGIAPEDIEVFVGDGKLMISSPNQALYQELYLRKSRIEKIVAEKLGESFRVEIKRS